jgi:hypothetical protein
MNCNQKLQLRHRLLVVTASPQERQFDFVGEALADSRRRRGRPSGAGWCCRER